MRLKNYGCNTSFLDLLFNMLLAFTALFVMAFAMINQNKDQNKTNTESKAEYLITISWDNELDNDVDTYLEDPAGHLICFRRREDGLMHLDRDDLGHSNDKSLEGKILFPFNREIATLRGTLEGEYCLNVHAYRFPVSAPCLVTVQIDKINPLFQTILLEKVTLTASGEEQTVVRFKLNKKSEFVGHNHLQKKLTVSQNIPSYQAPMGSVESFPNSDPESPPSVTTPQTP